MSSITESSNGSEKQRPQHRRIHVADRETLKSRFEQAEFYGVAPQLDRFFDAFVDSVADTNKSGFGLALAWRLSGLNSFAFYEHSPSLGLQTLALFYDRTIAAITQEPEVVKEAKEIMQRMHEELD